MPLRQHHPYRATAAAGVLGRDGKEHGVALGPVEYERGDVRKCPLLGKRWQLLRREHSRAQPARDPLMWRRLLLLLLLMMMMMMQDCYGGVYAQTRLLLLL